MIEYLYKEHIHYLILHNCCIREFHISQSDEYGCFLSIVYYSFISHKDEAFTYSFDDDVDDLDNICFRRDYS